jgi:hypothetical protein
MFEPKEKTKRDRGYLDWCSTQSCGVCSRKKGVCGAHDDAAGTGVKGNDYDAVPLCVTCHSLEHRGKETFWRNVQLVYKKTREELVKKFNKKYSVQFNIPLELINGSQDNHSEPSSNEGV